MKPAYITLAAEMVLLPLTLLYAAPATQPSADALAKAAIDSEQWIHQVKSFYLRVEGTWTQEPESVARRTTARKKQFPTTTIDPARFPELRPEGRETLVVAFDDQRVYRHSVQVDVEDETAFWDGQRTFGHTKYFTHSQESYGISLDPKRVSDHLFVDLSWLRAGYHSFWWEPREDSHPDRAQGWKLTGRENYRGVDCWVIEKRNGWEKWYVGVERPLLHGHVIYVRSNKDARVDRLAVEVATEHGGKAIKSAKEAFKWIASLPEEEKKQAYEEHSRRGLKYAFPLAEHFELDYKEIAPGRWFPMTQGYEMYNDDQQPVIFASRRTLKVVDLKIDEPLPEDLFKMEFVEGVDVVDRTHEPLLTYKYKKNFSKEEWQAILDKAAERRKRWDAEKKSQQAIVGQPAPAFDVKSEWINSRPLTWAELKGQVVLVDFFADWCGPCQNDLPTLSELHKKREENHIAVLAIHPPGSKREAIDKVLKQFDLQYPICIDLPPPDVGESFGKLYAEYRVKGIPHVVVVDKSGNVAGQGTLGEMLTIARKLAQ